MNFSKFHYIYYKNRVINYSFYEVEGSPKSFIFPLPFSKKDFGWRK